METINIVAREKAIKRIEQATIQFKKRRLTSQKYREIVTECLLEIDSKRDYIKYLRNIGQPIPLN